MQNTAQQANNSSRNFSKVCDILKKYSYDQTKLITILQEVQKEYLYLPQEVLTYLATALGISPARIYGVASFYSHFALAPQGKYVIRICDGTACHVKQSIPILEAIQKRLNLDDSKKTTPDMLFTLETVSCLGACGLAPVIVINDEVHGQMTPESTLELIENIISNETNNA